MLTHPQLASVQGAGHEQGHILSCTRSCLAVSELLPSWLQTVLKGPSRSTSSAPHACRTSSCFLFRAVECLMPSGGICTSSSYRSLPLLRTHALSQRCMLELTPRCASGSRWPCWQQLQRSATGRKLRPPRHRSSRLSRILQHCSHRRLQLQHLRCCLQPAQHRPRCKHPARVPIICMGLVCMQCLMHSSLPYPPAIARLSEQCVCCHAWTLLICSPMCSLPVPAQEAAVCLPWSLHAFNSHLLLAAGAERCPAGPQPAVQHHAIHAEQCANATGGRGGASAVKDGHPAAGTAP